MLLLFVIFTLALRASSIVALSVQRPLLGHASHPYEIKSDAWTHLKQAVDGRLYAARPLGSPCYTGNDKHEKGFDPHACSVVRENQTKDYFISEQFAGYYFSNWATCQNLNTSSQGCAVPLNNSTEMPLTSICNQGAVPNYYIEVAKDEDVKAGLKFAEQHNVQLVVKNTGHDWKGRSSGPIPLALWTHRYRPNMTITSSFIPEGCTEEVGDVVTFGAGYQWRDLYEFTHKYNFDIVGGTCGSVGVVGWFAGGGHSKLSPRYGLGVDEVQQIRIVLPNGEVRVASRCQNADIFYAAVGGGGGTFGVIMEASTRIHHIREIQAVSISFGASSLADDMAKGLYDVLTKNANRWHEEQWGGYVLSNRASRTVALITPKLNGSEAADSLKPLTKYANQYNATVIFETFPSWYDYIQKYYIDPPTRLGGAGAGVASRLIPSSVFSNASSRARLTGELVKLHSENLYFMIALGSPPTAFAQNATSPVSPSWYGSPWLIRISTRWDPYGRTPEENFEDFARVNRLMKPLRETAPEGGVSISEADIWEPDHVKAFWGEENYAKLSAIKTNVDPHNMMEVYQGVNWNKNSDRFSCYPSPST